MQVIASEDKEDREVIDEMIMRIGEMPVQVAWEDNESVEALKELISDSPLSIQMSMYRNNAKKNQKRDSLIPCVVHDLCATLFYALSQKYK